MPGAGCNPAAPAPVRIHVNLGPHPFGSPGTRHRPLGLREHTLRPRHDLRLSLSRAPRRCHLAFECMPHRSHHRVERALDPLGSQTGFVRRGLLRRARSIEMWTVIRDRSPSSGVICSQPPIPRRPVRLPIQAEIGPIGSEKSAHLPAASFAQIGDAEYARSLPPATRSDEVRNPVRWRHSISIETPAPRVHGPKSSVRARTCDLRESFQHTRYQTWTAGIAAFPWKTRRPEGAAVPLPAAIQ